MTNSSVTPLAASVKAVLAPDMRSDEQPEPSFTRLWRQIAKITSANTALPNILERSAAAIGTAFQADACTIAQPAAPLAQCEPLTHQVAWFAGGTKPNVYALSSALASLDTLVQPISITDIGNVVLDELEPALRTVIEFWQAQTPIDRTIQAMAVVPAQHNSVSGMVSVAKFHLHQWTAAELEGLEMVAHQLAIAIAQRQLQEHLNQQIQYQQVVNQLTIAIRNSSDLNEILKMATEGTAQALHVERGMLLRLKYWDPLFRNRSQEQIPRVRVSLAYEWLLESMPSDPSRWQIIDPKTGIQSPNHPSFWMSECELCQHAFLQPASPLILQDHLQLQQANFATIAAPFEMEQFPALLMAPLESQGTVLGFLVFQRQQAHAWQPEELELVELVSAQVSTAIIQTETLRQVQALVEKRTAELRESLSVQAKLYDRTRQQVEQLRHLNQLKDEFLSAVNHELRTPLTSMTMAIRMLRQVGLQSDRGTRYLDILEQQCAQEINLINDLLALQELESKRVPIQFQEIEIGSLIAELSEAFQTTWAAKGLTFSLDLPAKPLRLMSDRDSLSRILLELLTNASKYSDPNTCIKLKVRHQTEPNLNEVRLTLCNVGPGISADELPHIFEKFTRCAGVTQNAIQGTGLGLALVKCLVQHLNGSISASSHLQAAAPTAANTAEICFALSLPQIADNAKL